MITASLGAHVKQVNSPQVAKQYIKDALNGKILVCKWVKLFCKRHIKDLESGAKRGIYFDEEAGEKVLQFFHFLRHSKGEWAGRPFILAPWEQAYLWILFGWKRKNGNRRFRLSYLEIARKNGKSTLAAGVALYLLDADGEPGAEVYSAATKRDQAKIVHSEATRMARSSPPLRRYLKLHRDNIHVFDTNSKFEPLSSDFNSLDGLNIHGAIVDEVHAHKTRDLWDILETATGARRQPMLFAITTAGVSRESICRELHDYTEKVLDGSLKDDSHCGIIYTLDDGDDWMSERVWVKANPNLKESVKIDDLRDKARKAKEAPSALNAFLRLHMNMWTQGDKRWIDPDVWNACNGRTDIELLRSEPCYGGLDLSTTTDITAFVLKFPNTGDVLAWFWIPEDEMEKRERRDRVPFSSWVRMGFVEATPGNVIDYEYIKTKILNIAQDFKGLVEIGFDPWNATQIGIQLEEEGVKLADVGQGYKSLSPAAKELEREYLSGELKHGGNPVLRWMAANVVLETDPAENIKPSKKRSAERIDGIVALCCAISRQIAAEGSASVYESRGMVTL
jgi:phage terminase large subunit-like protein